MEQLCNGFQLEICEGSFPLSTDSMALAGFTKLPKAAQILDLGSGCGTLGMLLCASHADCAVTGIELDEDAHLTALKNACANNLSHRLKSICADIASVDCLVKPGSFHACVSNPPYFTGGPQSKTVPLARQEILCSMDALFKAAAWALKYGGDFFLVHRPERLAELFSCACRHGLEPKRLQLLRHRTGGPVSLVLVQCRKGAKPGLTWEDESLHMPSGEPTAYYRQLYHI